MSETHFDEYRLLDCPFCGHEAHLVDNRVVATHGHIRFQVECMSVACMAESRVTYSREEAVRVWNRRVAVASADPLKLLKQARAVLWGRYRMHWPPSEERICECAGCCTIAAIDEFLAKSG